MTDYEALVSTITEKAPYAEGKVRRERRIEFTIPADRIRDFLKLLKDNDFELLLQITAVDWPDRGEIELIYQVFSITHRTHTFVRTAIPRDNSVVPTVMDIYPVAETYERDAHEFFQVVFEGNPKLKMPWILEEEDKEAGLSYRKDFDMLGYVKRKYKILDRFDEDKDTYVI
ncbi:NADH-quinone oxidoreductase subunit C [Thermococcus thioreducens]|uniref:Membrane bound protein complex subunit mbxK n=1 Tax=Thermococcus thioreducens TaxID=277988 RepID=A0A0Q2M4P5_9EURY|nr:NADH-quinone oxidoreductase subunit C [Thermococcus thioreducens]ASJ12254.1 NADH dehydrogenase [Thermococcus thioreducens]KQH82993.1 NADH dehydrogenase [Thermococcus thioreducens]SEV94095.1 Membrane bound protein complex subunit mbxK [Thermococcus thioreducens]